MQWTVIAYSICANGGKIWDVEGKTFNQKNLFDLLLEPVQPESGMPRSLVSEE